ALILNHSSGIFITFELRERTKIALVPGDVEMFSTKNVSELAELDCPFEFDIICRRVYCRFKHKSGSLGSLNLSKLNKDQEKSSKNSKIPDNSLQNYQNTTTIQVPNELSSHHISKKPNINKEEQGKLLSNDGIIRTAHKPNTKENFQKDLYKLKTKGDINSVIRINALKKLAKEVSNPEDLEEKIFDISHSKASYCNKISLTIKNIRQKPNEKNELTIKKNDQRNLKPNYDNNMISMILLTEDKMKKNGYPCYDKELNTFIIEKTVYDKEFIAESDGYLTCSRCYKQFIKVEKLGDIPNGETCNYHPQRLKNEKGSSEKIYRCCSEPSNSQGCENAIYHIFDSNLNCEGFTFLTDENLFTDANKSKLKLFSMDCEMVYTTNGNEVARISIIDEDFENFFDSLILPSGEIIDYNTMFSGLNEENMK
ncbi:MAG: RNA exonuclease 1, partial [Paramarteilia canceri]